MIEAAQTVQQVDVFNAQEIDVQISTAKRFPRNFEQCVNEAIAMATMDEETAESCIYSLPRGVDKRTGEQNFIKGESVRLAEILMSAWGNLRVAKRVIENNGKIIKAEGVAWDLEKNLKISGESQRRITDKYGKTYSEDMQVVTGNAAMSIAMRNAVLAVIPRAFARKVYLAAVNFAIGDQNKIPERINKAFSFFKENWGIDSDKIYKYFGHEKVTDFTKDDVEELLGIRTAITSGDIKANNAFEKVGSESAKVATLESVLLNDEPKIEVKEEKKPESMAKIFEKNINGGKE